MARRMVGLAVILATLGFTQPAVADDINAAHEAYSQGTRLFDLGDYREALAQFKKAYLNYESPAFLYNIAQCHRLLGDKEEAKRLYQTYLRMAPDASDREEIQRIIAALDGSPATGASGAPPDTPPPPATPRAHLAPAVAPPLAHSAIADAEKPPKPTPLYRRWWLWTAVAVVAVAVVAIAVGVATAPPHFRSTLPDVQLGFLVPTTRGL